MARAKCPPPSDKAVSEVIFPEAPPVSTPTNGGTAKLHTFKGVSIDGKKIDLKAIEHESEEKPAKGTIFFLCGGPKACIKDKRPKNLPRNFNVVTFDYIGLGRNSAANATATMMSLDTQARIAAEIVKGLKLKDYVIYGHSLGSAIATVASSQVGEKSDVPQPKAVILEGVLGPRKEGLRDFSGVSNRIWSKLNPTEQAEIAKTMERIRATEPRLAKEYDEKLIDQMAMGPALVAGDFHEGLQYPRGERIALLKKNVLGADKSNGNFDNSKKGEKVYSALACQAIRHHDRTEGKYYFAEGILKARSNAEVERAFCGCRSLSKDYAPSDYQIRAPILYINGDGDPLTPESGARQHFDSQRSAPSKAFITVKDGGHYGTWHSLSGCVNTFFSTAMTGDPSQIKKLDGFHGDCAAPATGSAPQPRVQ